MSTIKCRYCKREKERKRLEKKVRRERQREEHVESTAAINLSQSNYDNLVALFLISAAFAIEIVTLSLVFKIPIGPVEQPIRHRESS